MSLVAFLGAVELGFIYALVALAVFLSFRVLDFPDLTVDGSFPLGAAVAATAIVGGVNPYLATAMAIVAGAMAGLATAILNVRFKILGLLASILTMIALYSINLRIMGKPNVALLTEATVFTPFEPVLRGMWLRPLFAGIVAVAAVLLLGRFLSSEAGLAMRAVGVNRRMAEAQGIDLGRTTAAGMALSNALVALAGALFAQANGFADVTIGTGTIVVGLASVIVGETIIKGRSIYLLVAACLLGSLLYRFAIALALEADFLGLQASDLNLITAVLVGLALILPGARARLVGATARA